MPIQPVQYQPRPYVRGGTIGELLRLRGQRQAEAILRGGEISANLWANLGNTIGQTIQGYAKERAEAPIRARQAEAEELDLQARRNDVEQQNRLNRQDSAFMALLEQQPNPDPREVISIYGPQRGMAIAQGMAAFGELQQNQVRDARDTAGRLAAGVKALSPEVQASFWPSIREAAIKGGLGSADTVPEQATPEFLNAVIGWASGEAPTQQPLIQRDPTRDLVDPFTGTVVTPGTPAVETPPNPTEASLAAAAARGDATAREALRLLRAQDAPSGPRTPVWVVQDGQFVDLAGIAPPGSQPANQREQGRAVTSGDAGRIAEFDTSLDDVAVLTDAVTGNGATGTAARIGAAVPNWLTEYTGWGSDAKSKNAVIARVRQVIGKALEGGVLRKEDEEKYKNILPTIEDPPEVVRTKLQGLSAALIDRRARLIESLDAAGFETGNFPTQYQPRRPNGSGVMVNMRAPDGRSLRVPAEQVDEAKRRGATVVGQ